jgi:CHASE2 domain-containing sensor protein
MYGGARSSQLWIAITLIFIGSVFLVQNYAGVMIGNWWALFILIPASLTLGAAWSAWRSGLHPAAVSGPLIGGLMMLSVAAIFMLGLQWSKVWPVFLILIGIGVLVPSLLGRRERHEKEAVSRG